jgi:hypothetical protein
MPISDNARSAEAIRRKLRALAAVFLDPAATEHEKANAKMLKVRLETQLGKKPTSEGAAICQIPACGGMFSTTWQPLQSNVCNADGTPKLGEV